MAITITMGSLGFISGARSILIIELLAYSAPTESQESSTATATDPLVDNRDWPISARVILMGIPQKVANPSDRTSPVLLISERISNRYLGRCLPTFDRRCKSGWVLRTPTP